MPISINAKWIDEYTSNLKEAAEHLSAWGKEMAEVMMRANKRINGGQQS